MSDQLEQYTAEYNAAVANGHIEKARRLARVIAALEYNLVTRPSVAPEEDNRPVRNEPRQVDVLREALSLGAPDLLEDVRGRLGLLVNCLNASGYRITKEEAVPRIVSDSYPSQVVGGQAWYGAHVEGTEPRTEAGRDALSFLRTNVWRQAILAIEAEAAQEAAPPKDWDLRYQPIYLNGGGDPDFATIDAYLRMHFNAHAEYEGAAPRAEGLDVENVARVLHELGFVYWAGADDHPPFGECYCSDARREDARDFLARLSRPSDERVPESEEPR